ncbi:MAG: serine protease [Deltaproteobacteria bacterium]|nr:serine protease [Deltaproteobacteria bacterium]
MNASVTLLERVLPATVQLQGEVPADHPSAAILGCERAGSGTVVDSAGLILTVQYIVVGAQSITVTLLDGSELAGEVAAQDFATGIALVRVDGRKLPVAKLSASTGLQRGQEVFIVAALGDNARRVSNGAVSSLDAFDAYWEYRLERAITTTAVNPGLTGGGLFDGMGHLVGVVSLDLNEVGRFTLAVPVENFLDHRQELLRNGRRTTRPPRAWVGLYCYTWRGRLIIAGVLPGTPAESGGLKAGDVLLTVDGREVTGRAALYQLLWAHSPGDTIACTVFRSDEIKPLAICAGDAEAFFA